MRALVLVCVAGCTFPDLERKAVDAAVDIDADPSTVRGTSQVQHLLFDGTSLTVPEDLSRYVIKAYVPNGDGTFTIVDGVGTSSGELRIPSIPIGATYYLSLEYPAIPNRPVQEPRMFVTTKRDLDLGFVVVGRPDGTVANLASNVILDITNLVPWNTDDYILIDSYNNGSEFHSGIEGTTNRPDRGDTALSGLSFDWRNGSTFHPVGTLPALVDATKGDDFFVSQIHVERQSTGLAPYDLGKHVASLKRTDLVQTDGTAMNVAGAMTQLTLNKTANVTVQLGQFRSQYSDRDRIFNEAFDLFTVDGPATQHQNTFGVSPWSISFGTPVGLMRPIPDTFVLPPITYGEPGDLPTAWSRIVFARYDTFRRHGRIPGGTSGGTGRGVATSYAAAGSTISVTPAVRPPAQITVGTNTNTDVPGVVAYDGAHGVTIDWDDVVQADAYNVSVEVIFLDGTAMAARDLFQIRTTESTVTIPPQFLVQGQRYLVAVSSVKGSDAAGLRRFRIPGGFASRSTALLLFSAACGNGTVDAALGEECDTAGPSATCDADCSVPACGDAYHNTFTSEACDQGGAFTRACDADCTLPVCGDGSFNGNAEDCDDGNTVDNGNGCSATCTRVGRCGDGVVQSFFETCEPPNTATCRADCRPL